MMIGVISASPLALIDFWTSPLSCYCLPDLVTKATKLRTKKSYNFFYSFITFLDRLETRKKMKWESWNNIDNEELQIWLDGALGNAVRK